MKLRSGVMIAAAVGVLALAGCNNGSGSGPTAGGDALSQYRDCMTRNGVTLPSFGPRPSGFPTERPTNRPTVRPSRSPGEGFPGGGVGNRFPQGVDLSAFAKAQQACGALRPSGQPGFGFGGNGRQGDGRNAAYRNCLMEHGVTPQNGQQPNANDPKTAAALQTCAVLKPSPSPTN